MVDRLLDLPTPVRVALFGFIASAVMALGYLTLQPASEPETEPVAAEETSQVATPEPVVVPQPTRNAAPQDDLFVEDYAKDVDLDLQMPVSEDALGTIASRAARFTQLYLSYSYTQNNDDKQTEIERLLAEENVIDFTKMFPEGAVQAEFEDTETEISVEVDQIALSLITADILGFTITTTSTTSTVSDASTASTDVYALTMFRDEDRSNWYVSEFSAQAGAEAFQDEQQVG